MDPRFVTKTMHAYLDYPVALTLMAMPFLLQLGTSHPLALWLGPVAGLAALLLTILTDHKTGLIRILPYTFHLVADFTVGILFLAIPAALGFSGPDAWYYFANAAAVLTVVALHKAEPSRPMMREA
ncbi:hypothetical protein [Nisaea sediminum]|uniref:hypothetical protein n=1 Tax=Nisaea sediminum TaxID=2775867 RepID=UPI0018672F18|nr:hypothetical protein [Nisaea sediminum]